MESCVQMCSVWRGCERDGERVRVEERKRGWGGRGWREEECVRFYVLSS